MVQHSKLNIENPHEKWFTRLSNKIISAYKDAILEYPLKKYKSIQLHWTGQGFSLGLSVDTNDDNHRYIKNGDWHNEQETSLITVYRELEDIPYEEYDEEDDCYYEAEFEREEWPFDETDCYELEYFLINVGLGIGYLKLKADEDLKKHLGHIETIKITSVDRKLGVFTYHFPDEQIKKNILQTLLEDAPEQELVLNLWGKEAQKTAKDFLNNF